MVGIAAGKEITLLYNGHAFVPSEPVDLRKGSVVRVTISEVRPNESEVLEKYAPVIGTIHAPEGFDWNYDRDDLYRDVA